MRLRVWLDKIETSASGFSGLTLISHVPAIGRPQRPTPQSPFCALHKIGAGNGNRSGKGTLARQACRREWKFGVNFEALATDYDDTLAQFGRTDAPTLQALQRVKQSGRKLILVTGRVLPDLKRVFPEITLFDLVVAENGALLYDPHRDEETLLAEPPPEDFVATLRDFCITPLEVGRTIVATREPNESIVLATIRDLGLEHHIIFNKGAVMVLPPNVNKAFGLEAALSRLGLSPRNVVGIGDAENDHAFLDACGCAVAVGNALPALKEKADLVVKPRGQGVVEVANLLLAGGLRRSQRVTHGTASPEVGRGSAR